MGLVLMALVVGVVFGAIVQRTHFCTMGAIADVALFASLRRLRGWLLAIAVAMAGSQLLAAFRLIRFDGTALGPPARAWPLLLVGGLAFGFGMVLAGGCLSRNLARLGAGSLKALLVILLAAVFGAMTLAVLQTSPLARIGSDLGMDARWLLPDVSIPPWLGIAAACGVALFCLRDARLRASPRDLWGGVGVGMLVPAAWIAASSGSDPSATGGLTFAVPLADMLVALTSPPLAAPSFAAALVVGTICGAWLAARLARQLRLETFSGSADMVRHVVGGILMGCGGAMAGGCTVGHGITGIAALAPSSVLAMIGIVTGAVWALRWLETGRLIPRAVAIARREKPTRSPS